MPLDVPTELLIGPAIFMGIILSLLEIHFVHIDEVGMHWFRHALHTIPPMFIFTFIAMNVGWALNLLQLDTNFWIDLGARVAIGIVAMVKIKAAASLTGRGGIGESNMHVLIIGVLVMASPYIWEYLLEGLIGQYIPF